MRLRSRFTLSEKVIRRFFGVGEEDHLIMGAFISVTDGHGGSALQRGWAVGRTSRMIPAASGAARRRKMRGRRRGLDGSLPFLRA